MTGRLQVFDVQVGFQLALMESLTVPILATLPAATAIAPILLALLALTALAVVLMGLLARDGHRFGCAAKQPDADLVPVQVLIASHEPALRSMTGRRAAAPSRAPPFGRHLIGLTVLPSGGDRAPADAFIDLHRQHSLIPRESARATGSAPARWSGC